ncbi:MAG: hypothetical protein A2Z15_06375 [Chloroflexi bacterium RBG_16_50_11]|nr:MAG: hypothetical protein A2Z15_06375 [Chloroflexi bacterium RBG_16_50_11]
MIVTERFKNLDWLAMVFYPLAVILMEAFWVSPWLSYIGVWPFFSEARPVLSLASVIIVIVVSLLVTRIFTRQKMPLWAIQVIIIGGGLVTMLLVLRLEYAFISGSWFGQIWQILGETFTRPSTIVVAIPAVIYLWWRGIVLGQSTSYFKDIYRSFVLGMVALIALIVFWQISAASGNIPKPGSDIAVNIIAFFFFGLLAIAISHLYNMRNAMPKEEARLTSVWRWLPVMLGVIGGMIIIGFAVASAISPDLIESIGRGVQTVFEFLGKILGYIITPIIYLVQGLVLLFKWFMGLFASGEAPQQFDEMGDLLPPEFQVGEGADLPPVVTETIKWVVLAIIIGLVIFFLARAISRYRSRRAREDIDEVRESLGGWRGFKDDLKLLFKSLGQKFQRKPPPEPPFVFDEDAAGRLDIREIFRHLQWEANRSGIPRRRHETAEEYVRRIEHVVPESSLPLNDLTGMYETVRYGENIVPEEKVDNANGIWQTLKGLIRRLRGD